MTRREIDDGPSDEDIARFARDDTDFDDGMFPNEREHAVGKTRLHWHHARVAAIAGILLIIFIIFLVV